LTWTAPASFLLISLIQIRIFIYEKKKTVAPAPQGAFDNRVTLVEMEKYSMFDFALAGILILLTLSSILNYYFLRKLRVVEFNEYP